MLTPRCKNAIFSKIKQFRAMVSIDDLGSYVIGLFKNPIIGFLKFKMAEIRHLENRHDVIFSAEGGPIWIKSSETGPNRNQMLNSNMAGVLANSLACHLRAMYHIAGCCHLVNSLSHATLQGAVTWRNQCHDRATLQGVRIPSAILKIVFFVIFFFVFNAA